MSLVMPRSLPSLAHPIIVSTENNEDAISLRRPPFPEIDLNADGFTFPFLHWVAIKTTNGCLSDAERRKLKLAILHETYHRVLSMTPLSMFIKAQIFKLCAMLLRTFEAGKEQIPVPLDPKKRRNKLEEQWQFITLLDGESRCIDEVYAVRTSLVRAREGGVIKNDRQLEGLIDYYKKMYGEMEETREFPVAYHAFELVASTIGETAAWCVIQKSFETLSPRATFFAIISAMCKIDPCAPNGFVWNLDDQPELIAKLSYEGAYYYFSGLLDNIDNKNGVLSDAILQEPADTLQQKWSEVSRDTNDDFMKFLLDSFPATIVLTKYASDNIQPFIKCNILTGEFSKEAFYGEFSLVVEAIRQQLTQGIGVQCPFWTPYNPCCSRRNRVLLEDVWKCTSDSACELWKRRGCLE
jgi:hypothetical protein